MYELIISIFATLLLAMLSSCGSGQYHDRATSRVIDPIDIVGRWNVRCSTYNFDSYSLSDSTSTLGDLYNGSNFNTDFAGLESAIASDVGSVTTPTTGAFPQLVNAQWYVSNGWDDGT